MLRIVRYGVSAIMIVVYGISVLWLIATGGEGKLVGRGMWSLRSRRCRVARRANHAVWDEHQSPC